jgi:hypothetical protein
LNDDPLGGSWYLRLPALLPLPMAGCLVRGHLASWKVFGPLWRCVAGGFSARRALLAHPTERRSAKSSPHTVTPWTSEAMRPSNENGLVRHRMSLPFNQQQLTAK